MSNKSIGTIHAFHFQSSSSESSESSLCKAVFLCWRAAARLDVILLLLGLLWEKLLAGPDSGRFVVAAFNVPPFFNEPNPPVDRIAAIKLLRPSALGEGLMLAAFAGKLLEVGIGGGGGGGAGAPFCIGESLGGGGGGGGTPPVEPGALMLNEGIEGDCLMPLFGTGGGGGDMLAIEFGLFIIGGIGGGAGAFEDLFLDGGGGGGALLPIYPNILN